MDVTLAIAAEDWYILIVTTVMNAPAAVSITRAPAVVSTSGYWRLVACTLHVVKPDFSWSFTVVLTYIYTGSVAHTHTHTHTPYINITIFLIKIEYCRRKTCRTYTTRYSSIQARSPRGRRSERSD